MIFLKIQKNYVIRIRALGVPARLVKMWFSERVKYLVISQGRKGGGLGKYPLQSKN